MFSAFTQSVDQSRLAAGLEPLKIIVTDPLVVIGLLLGGILPFFIGALTMTAVGRAAGQMVDEIRRQFREIPGLLEGQGGGQAGRGPLCGHLHLRGAEGNGSCPA